MFVLASAWSGQHTDASRWFSNRLVEAKDAERVKATELADALDIDDKELSRELSGLRPMNAHRLAQLRSRLPKVWRRFLKFLAEDDGGMYLSPEEVALLRAAAVLGPKRMAKMLPLPEERNERSA